jgi:C-terminal processing protease CtpA/Prc
MKKMFAILVVMLIVAMPAVAGEKGKCSGSGEDCYKKMKAKYGEKAWLGIEYDTDEHGRWVVAKVYKGSPAQKAGFEAGDVLLAVNGAEYSKENKKELKAVFAKIEPGSEVKYIVKRQGGKVKLDATLGNVPKELQAKWIHEHMETHHPEFQMASK